MVDVQTVTERLEALKAYLAEAERLAPIAGFRNILVHEYLAVDPAKLYAILIHGRADLQEFGRRIAEYLRQTGALGDEAYDE